MKVGGSLLLLAWFSASICVGYRLTERAFSGLRESPAFSTIEQASGTTDNAEAEERKDRLPDALIEAAKRLTPGQLACLRASIETDRVSAVLAGDITPKEAAAARKCLE